MRDQVQLIAYADRLGGSVAALHELLDGPLAGLFGGVHVLPFFRPYDGADAGFDPEDHTAVDPRLGTWDDVAALGAGRDLVVDVIVNHVSTGSPQFRDVVARGAASPHAGMFLTYDRVFPDGATQADLLTIFRPRPGLPFTEVVLGDGSRHLLWTTFTSAQADVDVAHPATREYLRSVLERL
jgi:sucrose phosphorylase